MKIIAVIAIALCGTVGLTAVPASAKTKSSDPTSVLNPKESAAPKSCEGGPAAPYVRHPGHMNRGFLKGRC